MIKLLKRFWKWLDSGHKWEYRNPYDRTCTKCGYRENLYGDALGPDTWEQVYPLPHSPEACGNTASVK